mmetsp:Transcript_15222/g.26816  ORF Transcript_15222/g.26816 Transcript_15222/m.26816 type:complete len:84 (+) Transcript_15222:71-322(+)
MEPMSSQITDHAPTTNGIKEPSLEHEANHVAEARDPRKPKCMQMSSGALPCIEEVLGGPYNQTLEDSCKLRCGSQQDADGMVA